MGIILLTGTAWGNCTKEERVEMQRLGLDASVIAYTCEEEIEIAEEEPPIVSIQEVPEEAIVVNQEKVADETGYRQQISIGWYRCRIIYEPWAKNFFEWNCFVSSISLG